MERKDRDKIAAAFGKVEDLVLGQKGNDRLRAAAEVVEAASDLLRQVVPGERRTNIG